MPTKRQKTPITDSASLCKKQSDHLGRNWPAHVVLHLGADGSHRPSVPQASPDLAEFDAAMLIVRARG